MEESLNIGIKKLTENGDIGKFHLKNGNTSPSHSLFIDDLIVFTNDKKGSLENLINFLRVYQVSSK
jgi:hypothetical protein